MRTGVSTHPTRGTGSWSGVLVHHRRRGHVVGGGGAAVRAGGVRRRARGCIAAVHADDDRLRLRQHRDGQLSDRFGIMVPVILGALALAAGYAARRGRPPLGCNTRWRTALLIGVGTAATFAPLLAHMSLWFARSGAASRSAIIASGNYLAGTMWPPIVAHFIATRAGARRTSASRSSCLAAMLPLALTAAPAAAARRTLGGVAAPPVGSPGSARTVAVRAADAAGHRRASPAAWRCRCRRCISSPTAAIWATAPRAARRCCRDAGLRHREPPRRSASSAIASAACARC